MVAGFGMPSAPWNRLLPSTDQDEDIGNQPRNVIRGACNAIRILNIHIALRKLV